MGTGPVTISDYNYSETETFAIGWDGDVSYDFHMLEFFEQWWSGWGNHQDGTYTHLGNVETGSTAHELNEYEDGEAEFVEILFESYNFVETGNLATGTYTRLETDGYRTSSLEATTIDTSGTYTVEQESEGTFERSEEGDRISGDYEKSEEASDEYWMEMTASGDRNFTLYLSGTHSWTSEEEGNSISGLYVRTQNGTDNYEMEMSGERGCDAYFQTVSGAEEYTLVESGNRATGNYTQTITGDGAYERESTGPGAIMPSDNDVYDYFWEVAADPHSGFFDLTVSGISRYELLEDFYDISNTQPGRQPGEHEDLSFRTDVCRSRTR